MELNGERIRSVIKIQITDVKQINEQLEYSIIHTLIIPDRLKNDTILMNKAEKIINCFDTGNYHLSFINIDGSPYVQSHRVIGFHISTSIADIKAKFEQDYLTAQYILDNVMIPDFIMLNNTCFDGENWSEM